MLLAADLADVVGHFIEVARLSYHTFRIVPELVSDLGQYCLGSGQIACTQEHELPIALDPQRMHLAVLADLVSTSIGSGVRSKDQSRF